jgi:hypothetical protein
MIPPLIADPIVTVGGVRLVCPRCHSSVGTLWIVTGGALACGRCRRGEP